MVVADAKTGAILGSSTTPSFDPNLRNLTNYLDINVSVPYEPGSTMKIFTYMAAMENGVYHGEDTFKSCTFTTSDGTEIYINPLKYNLDGTGRKQAILFERKYRLAFFFNCYEYEVIQLF